MCALNVVKGMKLTMNKYIEIALNEAKKSLKTDDVPIGAVIVENGKIIAKGHNTREKNTYNNKTCRNKCHRKSM